MTVNANKLKSVYFYFNISIRTYFSKFKIRENKIHNLINKYYLYNKIVKTLIYKEIYWNRNYNTCVIKQDNINMWIMITIYNDFNIF